MTEHLLGGLFKGSVGGTDVFAYGVATTAEDEQVMVGALIFYQAFMVIGMTDVSFFPPSKKTNRIQRTVQDG